MEWDVKIISAAWIHFASNIFHKYLSLNDHVDNKWFPKKFSNMLSELWHILRSIFLGQVSRNCWRSISEIKGMANWPLLLQRAVSRSVTQLLLEILWNWPFRTKCTKYSFWHSRISPLKCDRVEHLLFWHSSFCGPWSSFLHTDPLFPLRFPQFPETVSPCFWKTT